MNEFQPYIQIKPRSTQCILVNISQIKEFNSSFLLIFNIKKIHISYIQKKDGGGQNLQHKQFNIKNVVQFSQSQGERIQTVIDK